MYIELQDFESNRRPNLDGLVRSAGFPPFEELSAQTEISGACISARRHIDSSQIDSSYSDISDSDRSDSVISDLLQ